MRETETDQHGKFQQQMQQIGWFVACHPADVRKSILSLEAPIAILLVIGPKDVLISHVYNWDEEPDLIRLYRMV